MYKIGIDLGGTKIEGIILDEQNNEIYRKRVSTEREKGYEHILNSLQILYFELVNKIEKKPHTFGIGTPGSISSKTGLLKNSNTTCLNGKPFISDLEKLIGRQVYIQNDANCFAIAEALMGAGKGNNVVFGVIMGTGCGGGIVYKGEVIEGHQFIGGEWGHMTIDPNGPDCYCGKKGCAETFISGSGVENRYFDLTKDKKSLEQIIADFRKQENNAVQIIDKFFTDYGRCMSNLITILDPDIVVLGGGLSNIEEVYSSGRKQVERYIFNDELKTNIVKNQCGDSAGVFGAALIGK